MKPGTESNPQDAFWIEAAERYLAGDLGEYEALLSLAPGQAASIYVVAMRLQHDRSAEGLRPTRKP